MISLPQGIVAASRRRESGDVTATVERLTNDIPPNEAGQVRITLSEVFSEDVTFNISIDPAEAEYTTPRVITQGETQITAFFSNNNAYGGDIEITITSPTAGVTVVGSPVTMAFLSE